jgi:DNA-binding MarR family transcriptional regulator
MSGRHEEPLGYLLYRVASALRGEVTATALDPVDLSFPQYICMRMLSRFPDRSNAELARDTGVSPQAMNMVLRSLEDRALVTRPASVASGRSLPAKLTRAGLELLERTDSGVHAAEQRLMVGLSAEQRREFRRILAALGSV